MSTQPQLHRPCCSRATWPHIAAVMVIILAFTGCEGTSGEGSARGAIVLSGTVDAHEAELAFQAGGRIERLDVDEGQTVKVRQVIAELAPRDYELALMRARAQAESARKALAVLQAGSRKQEIRAAEAAVAMAQQQLSYVRLVSPANGVVSTRLVEAGQVVSPGQPVYRIAELERPWVRAYVGEKDLPRVKLGQPAEVRVDGLPGKVLAGRLSFISPEAEFTPKTVETRALRVDLVYRVKVDVDNAEGQLKIGMPADVKLLVGK